LIGKSQWFYSTKCGCTLHVLCVGGAIIIIIINKVLIKVMLNKVIAGALYIVICG